MEIVTIKTSYPFLQGGGEMGEHTRNFDWEQTAIGSPDKWPQSLCTTVSNLLHSRFPMFLFWGEEYIQFYNDAYRPSFGIKGRHPSALGQRGEECWIDIWHIIFPLIRKVKASGEPTWHKNQLIPIYRNGKMEDVYWTFSYSLVLDDKYKAAGVLVTCIETKEAELLLANKELAYENVQKKQRAAELLIANKALVYENEQKEQKAAELIIANRELAYENEQKKQRAAELLIANKALVYENEQKEQRAAELIIANNELIRAGKALKESENNLRNMILQSPVAMAILKGHDFVLEIANERMYELWGRSKEKLEHNSIFEGLPEAKEQGFEKLLSEVFTTGATFSALGVPVSLPRVSGIETVYVNLLYEAFREGEGTITGVMVVANDVTEQVLAKQKIEEVVKQRTKELAEANIALLVNNQELEQFAYIASHDLQEPLRKVSNFTQLLRANLGDVDERSNTYLDKIMTSTERMTQLIQDVLSFSQLSDEHQTQEGLDLGILIQNLITDFELVIEQKAATINYVNLPTLKVYPVQMRQLFGNLLSNALKFTNKEVPPVITITAQPLANSERTAHKNLLFDVDYYVITVADNGIGFSQEYADKIFNVFHRLHGKAEFAGTGIGLAMCKKIAQNHHGEIWATSENEKGSTFHIILPSMNK